MGGTHHHTPGNRSLQLWQGRSQTKAEDSCPARPQRAHLDRHRHALQPAQHDHSMRPLANHHRQPVSTFGQLQDSRRGRKQAGILKDNGDGRHKVCVRPRPASAPTDTAEHKRGERQKPGPCTLSTCATLHHCHRRGRTANGLHTQNKPAQACTKQHKPPSARTSSSPGRSFRDAVSRPHCRLSSCKVLPPVLFKAGKGSPPSRLCTKSACSSGSCSSSSVPPRPAIACCSCRTTRTRRCILAKGNSCPRAGRTNRASAELLAGLGNGAESETRSRGRSSTELPFCCRCTCRCNALRAATAAAAAAAPNAASTASRGSRRALPAAAPAGLSAEPSLPASPAASSSKVAFVGCLLCTRSLGQASTQGGSCGAIAVPQMCLHARKASSRAGLSTTAGAPLGFIPSRPPQPAPRAYSLLLSLFQKANGLVCMVTRHAWNP